jgi:predicted nucleic acid-binding protein
VIVIDTSVWIPLLNGIDHPKAEQARAIIEGPEDIGVPGIILEEILRGLKSDAQFRRVRDLLLSDFTYLEATRSSFIHAAEIYRTLRKKGKTIRSPADCLIAACTMGETASLLEDDLDFHTIAEVVPLKLLGHDPRTVRPS